MLWGFRRRVKLSLLTTESHKLEQLETDLWAAADSGPNRCY